MYLITAGFIHGLENNSRNNNRVINHSWSSVFLWTQSYEKSRCAERGY